MRPRALPLFCYSPPRHTYARRVRRRTMLASYEAFCCCICCCLCLCDGGLAVSLGLCILVVQGGRKGETHTRKHALRSLSFSAFRRAPPRSISLFSSLLSLSAAALCGSRRRSRRGGDIVCVCVWWGWGGWCRRKSSAPVRSRHTQLFCRPLLSVLLCCIITRSVCVCLRLCPRPPSWPQRQRPEQHPPPSPLSVPGRRTR